MATLSIDSGQFAELFTVNQQTGSYILLSTANKYVDKDIKINTNVKSSTYTTSGAASASITSLTYTYNSSSGKFNITGSGTISGTATTNVSDAGWITTGNKTGSISGTASLSNITVNKIGIAGSLSGTKTTLKPVISKQDTPSGVQNAADGSATTTAPSSGTTRAYVAIKTAANTGTIQANPSVSSAGYGTTTAGQYTVSSSESATVGAAASDTTYVMIKQGQSQAGTATVTTSLFNTDGANAGTNISPVIGTTPSTTEPSSGYYVAVQAESSGASNIKTAGWFNTGDITASTASIIHYYTVTAGVYSTSGGGLTANTGYASITNNGCYTGGSYNTSDIIDITSQTSDAEGYYKLTAEGYGNVKRAAIKKTVTTAGYVPLNTSGTQTSAATNKDSNKGYAYIYIKKSNQGNISTSSTNSNQTYTIPAGYYPTDRTITIGAMSETTVTTSYSNSGMSTYFDSQASSSGASVTITPKYTNNTAGYLAAHTTATNNGGTEYWKIKTTSVSQGTSTKSGTSVTRGTATWNTGWITAGSISAASFGNTPSNGVTYLDISGTTAAPILTTEDGYLYINKGYTDNLKISLGQLIPNEITVSANDQILLGYTAYDTDGNILVGEIPSKNASDIVPSGNTLTIPWGKYEGTTGEHDAVTYTITSGDYSASAANTVAGTITPSVAINNASTYGFTTTQPSGTNGTNYLTIDPGASVTTKWKSTATATITTAGYIATGSKTATVEGTPSIAAGTNYYVPVITPAFTAGTITASISSNTITTTMTTTDTATSYYIDASAAGSASCTAPTWTNTSKGVISVTAGTNAGSAPTAANNLSKAATRVYIPAATGSIIMTAGNGSCSYNSTDSENITISDTDTSGVKVAFDGSGSVSATATTTAGYTPANNSYATGTSTSSGSTTGYKYVTGVTLVPPSSGTKYFDITVPNGSLSDYITFRFTVDTEGNVTVAGPD